MKRALWALLIMALVGSSSGCCILDRIFHCRSCGPSTYEDCCWEGHGCGKGSDCTPGGCATGGCSDGGCATGGGGMADAGCTSCGKGIVGHGHGHGGPLANLHARHAAQEAFVQGPPTGAVAYPYYTNRGPRDFLARTPASIGP